MVAPLSNFILLRFIFVDQRIVMIKVHKVNFFSIVSWNTLQDVHSFSDPGVRNLL